MDLKLNKYKDFYGLGAICAGVLLLCVSFFFGWTDHNIVLIPEVLLVLCGVGVHYFVLKKSSKY